MKKIKIIMTLCLGLIPLIAIAAKPFFYTGHGDEKIYLDINKGKKIIFWNDPKIDPQPPFSSDSIIQVIRTTAGFLKIYQESKSPLRKKITSDPINPKYSIYDCYGIGYLEVPNGSIDVELKSLADTTLLKQICKKFHCTIERQFCAAMPEFYQICLKPGDGRNPVETANALHETGLFASVNPEFGSTNMLHISYDPKTTEQWSLYNATDTVIDINVSR